MIQLRTLGELGLDDPERPEGSPLLGQAKPFALLCYLAFAGHHRFLRRDSLVALFWPELDHEHGRAALRQTLRVLRRWLGADAVVNRGDETALNPSRVWCDATAFEALCVAGEAEQAMELYRGDLLPALHVPGAAPELAQWLDDARAHLRRRAHDMARRCLDRHHHAADDLGACHWARRALELDPFDEYALRSLLLLLERTGDRAGAVREYQEFAARLLRELQVQPSAESEALIAAIRDSGLVNGERVPNSPPAAVVGPEPSLPEPRGEEVRAGASRWVGRLLLGALVGLLILVGLQVWPAPETSVAVQPNLVAVMPWRVEGADNSLAYLREGMVDLLAATLTGERGLRSADPRTVLQMRHSVQPDSQRDTPLQAALRVARRIGAGRLIEGAVVGNPAHLTLTATEYPVANPGAPLAYSVSGTIDRLPWMVDRLTAQLLAHETGDPGQLPSLLTTSLSALRVYLEGRAAFRRGLYGEAARDFNRALDLDSTFTLAALGLAAGGLTTNDADLMAKGRRIAWRDSSHLSARDRALLKAVVGMHYPAVPDEQEYFEARERAIALAPESPEAWYWLADSYFHQGRLLRLPDWSAHARTGFQKAIELDSAFAAPYQHLIELRLTLRDTVGVRRLAAMYFALDSTGEYRDFLRWRVAVGLGDSTALTALRSGFDHMSLESLYRIVGDAQLEGIALEDAERAAASLRARTAGTSRRYVAAYVGETLRSNEGRPGAALAESPGMVADGRRPLADRWFQVSDALYGDGDSAAAARAVDGMMSLAESPSRGYRGAAVDTQDVATCAVALWRLHHRQSQGVSRAIRRLRRRSPGERTGFGVWMNACATILEARLSDLTGSLSAAGASARLDSLVRAGPSLASPLRVAAALELAQLKERRGDLRGALTAVQRRENEYNPRYLSTQLLLEGRLSSRLGDRAAAIRAYRHYLVLRFDPEPFLRPVVDSVRATLAALEETPDRHRSGASASMPPADAGFPGGTPVPVAAADAN